MSEKFRKKMIFDVAGDSHPGLVRSRNEDAFLYSYNRDASCFLAAVADGIGGSANGDLASSLLLKYLFSKWCATSMESFASVENMQKFLCESIQDANAKLFAINRKYQHDNPMGTTIALLAFRKNQVLIIHAGDSRCSLIRNGQLLPLTKDHTLLNLYLASGKIKSAEEMNPALIHVITRSVGPEASIKLECNVLNMMKKDRFLICSDGVSLHVSEQEIAAETEKSTGAENCLRNIFRKVLSRGARDNLTMICICS